MAKVLLRGGPGKEIVDLPPVCMKCGAPSTVRKSKQFNWTPQWIGVLILVPAAYIVVALILTKRQRVETPLCDQHKSYWWMYPLIMSLAVLGILAFGFIAVIGLAVAGDKGHDTGGITALACVGFGVGLIVLLIAAVVMQSTRIRPTEITDRYVLTLTGVSQEFADAVDAEEDRQRSAFDRGDDYGRGPRRSRQDDDPRYTS